MGDLTQGEIRASGIALIVLVTVIFLSRFIGTAYHAALRGFTFEDAWVIVCYCCFIALAVLYLFIVPAFFRVVAGSTNPYPELVSDTVGMQKGLFAATTCLWFSLWSCKFALLSMYKKLVDGTKAIYNYLWWALAVFTALALVGCMVTLFLACSSMEAWFGVGQCYTPRDIVHAAISLWYAYAVDVLTDLLIMALPLRLIYDLRMPLARKISIGALFSLGFVLIIASTLRATQISNGVAQPTVPWLALWGTIESAIAVIIATAPGLYRVIRLYTRKDAQYYYYNDDTTRKTTRNGTHLTNSGREDADIALKDYDTGMFSRAQRDNSEEGLVYPPSDEITVTKSVQITHDVVNTATGTK